MFRALITVLIGHTTVWLISFSNLFAGYVVLSKMQLSYIFTVGEAVWSTCGKSHDEEKDHLQKLRFLPGSRATDVDFGKMIIY